MQVLKVQQIGLDLIKNLDEVLVNLSSTLDTMQDLAGTANSDLLPSLVASLEKLEDTLTSANSMIAPGSAIAGELEQLMGDLSTAARSLRLLAERLEEHPEELLRGKGG